MTNETSPDQAVEAVALRRALWAALRFAGSRSQITAAEESAILAAYDRAAITTPPQFSPAPSELVPSQQGRLDALADRVGTSATPPPTDLIARLREVEAAWADFVAKREAMNAARPDPMHATKAERDLYDERYQADNEAAHAMRGTSTTFAKWASDNHAADALQGHTSPRELRLEAALTRVIHFLGVAWQPTPDVASALKVARTALELG